MSNKKGEIATIITLGSLVVLGIVSLVSSAFLKKPIRIQPRASTNPPDDTFCNYSSQQTCFLACGENVGNCQRCSNGKYKCLSVIISTPTKAPTPKTRTTPLPTPTITPTLTPTPTSIPTPPLLSETGVLTNPGELIIENIGNNELRISAVSLQGSLIFS